MTERLEPADFFRWLDLNHCQAVRRAVKENYPSFSEEDLDDVWAETRNALVGKWGGENAVPVEPNLAGLLRKIALRRACDLLRRRNVQTRLIDGRRAEAEAKSSAEDRTNVAWWERLDPAEKRELTGVVAEAFGQLSPDEWAVLSVYCEHYPDGRGPTQLLALLNEQSPEIRKKAWSAEFVRKLLGQARMIVQEYLSKKGYRLDFER